MVINNINTTNIERLVLPPLPSVLSANTAPETQTFAPSAPSIPASAPSIDSSLAVRFGQGAFRIVEQAASLEGLAMLAVGIGATILCPTIAIPAFELLGIGGYEVATAINGMVNANTQAEMGAQVENLGYGLTVLGLSALPFLGRRTPRIMELFNRARSGESAEIIGAGGLRVRSGVKAGGVHGDALGTRKVVNLDEIMKSRRGAGDPEIYEDFARAHRTGVGAGNRWHLRLPTCDEQFNNSEPLRYAIASAVRRNVTRGE